MKTRICPFMAAVVAVLTLAFAPMPSGPAWAQAVGGDRNRDTDPAPGHIPAPAPDPGGPGVKVVPIPQLPGAGMWRLGVTVDVLDVGVRIRDVVPRSAAERAGLERDDIIVAINGYQIGRVMDRLYPIEDELQRRAGPHGDVRLLVLDRRSGRLLNVDARLDRWASRQAVIRGEVVHRERVTLPPGSELRIELRRRVGNTRETVARSATPIGVLPHPFVLQYPADHLGAGEYEVQAEVWNRGQRLYESRGRYPVRPGADVTGLQIQMRRS